MYIQELINDLTAIMEKQGNCPVVIDQEDLRMWTGNFEVVGKDYSINWTKDGEKYNQAFIVINSKLDLYE